MLLELGLLATARDPKQLAASGPNHILLIHAKLEPVILLLCCVVAKRICGLSKYASLLSACGCEAAAKQ